MSSNEHQTPDLASILKTLASLNQQSQVQQATQDSRAPPYSTTRLQPSQRAHQAPTTQSSNPTQATKIIDPATIIDWSSGLKCVMRTVAKHENMLRDIQHMIKVQHENEEQWWKGRQDFVEKQKARKENQHKLDEILQLVGGASTTGTSNVSPEELSRALETFDIKVYKAQLQLVKEFTSKLRSLGVPFFGTKSELVKIAGKEASGDDQGPKNEKGGIDEADLVKLQRRMLALLEDLCSD